MCVVYRGSAEGREQRAGALSGGRLAQRHDRDRLHNAAQGPVDGGRVQAGEERATDHQPESELHGPVAGARAGSAYVRRHRRQFFIVVVVVAGQRRVVRDGGNDSDE